MAIIDNGDPILFHTDDSGMKYYMKPIVQVEQTSGVGCFSQALQFIRLGGVHSDRILRERLTVHGPLKENIVPDFYSNTEASRALSRAFHAARATHSMYETSEKQALWERGAKVLLDFLDKQNVSLYILGDNIRDEQYQTSWFVEWLIKNKHGSVTCSPAVINQNHSSDERYCMAWFWVPPRFMGYSVPQADPVPAPLDPEKVLTRLQAQTFRKRHREFWMERLQFAKPAPKRVIKKKKEEESGELNQVSNV